MPLLTLSDLHFRHGDHPVITGVDLELEAGSTTVILGPSGCGKTTLLRLIAGLDRPLKGTITLEGTTVVGEGRFMQPEHRPIGMVFQGLALFPHLTVRGNVAFGLHNVDRKERNARVDQELRSVGLDGLAERFPHELSGGQQQRVAIARSLVRRPRLLLLDEPFSDLDPETRSQVRSEVKRILKEHGTTTIMVSHDREDAIHLGDRIATMAKGRIVNCADAATMRREWAARSTTS